MNFGTKVFKKKDKESGGVLQRDSSGAGEESEPPAAQVAPCQNCRQRPQQAPSPFCDNCSRILCRCGRNQKAPTAEFCEQCTRKGVRGCKHSMCVRFVVEKSDFCDLHCCPLCYGDKPSNALKCGACAAGNRQRQCKRMNKQGHQCTQVPDALSPYCKMHACPSCGNEKASTERTCTPCMSRCEICRADVGPGQTRCGTCQGLGSAAAARKLYIEEQARNKSMAPNRWLFVWDFDETITKYHASDHKGSVSPSSIQKNLVDPEFFKALILHLNAHGHHTKIATWADGDRAQGVVAQYLSFLFGPNEQRTVLHNEGIEAFRPHKQGMEPEGKNAHIRNLLRQINSQGQVLHESRVVLFDDREENIRHANRANHYAVHCPNGFNRNVWKAFTDMCGPSCLPELREANAMALSMSPMPPPPEKQSPSQLPNDGQPRQSQGAAGPGGRPVQAVVMGQSRSGMGQERVKMHPSSAPPGTTSLGGGMSIPQSQVDPGSLPPQSMPQSRQGFSPEAGGSFTSFPSFQSTSSASSALVSGMMGLSMQSMPPQPMHPSQSFLAPQLAPQPMASPMAPQSVPPPAMAPQPFSSPVLPQSQVFGGR